jgi:predicted dithiol-disulfide oxidoreductase (DUF899 family)
MFCCVDAAANLYMCTRRNTEDFAGLTTPRPGVLVSMTQIAENLPRVVSRDEWLAARKELLAREKELTKQRDALSADRRRLPMVRVEKDYVFTGPDGTASLLGLFDGRRQLMVGHFMFHPDWEDGCPSCSAGADEMSKGHLEHVNRRDTTFVYVSRAPIEKIQAYKAKKGWTFPWYSSFGSDFNYDFDVTLDESVKPIVYNYRTKEEYEARASRGRRPGRRWSGPAAAAFCAWAATCTTPTPCTRAAWRRSADRTTCWTRRRWGGRRTGRSPKAARPPRVAPSPTSPAEPASRSERA